MRLFTGMRDMVGGAARSLPTRDGQARRTGRTATVLARPLKPLPGDAPLGHRPTRPAALEDAQPFKAPEALAVCVAMASIKAGDKAS